MPPDKFRIGEYDCWALADGELKYPAAVLLPPGERPQEEIAVPYTALLVDNGSHRILIDTGAESLGPDTGTLLQSLASVGFSAGDIDLVVLSHGHPDHIAGVPRFPGAEIVMIRKEYEFWTATETQSRLEVSAIYGLGPLEPLMADYVRRYLVPAAGRLCLIEHSEKVAPGVLIFPAPGHTPGHAAVLVSSGRQQLLYIGDTVLLPAQVQNPEWVSAFDLDAEETVRTRKQLLERAVADRCLVAGFHMPHGLGVIRNERGRFRWAAEAGLEAVIR